MYMYVVYEETGMCVSTFLDFKEGKHCPSKSRCTTFKFNAGISHIGLKTCVISEKNVWIPQSCVLE